MGLLEFDEPFMKLRHQGMVLDQNGVKMSKSKGNVVNPNDMVERFGADATRMYMMFAAPLEDEIAFKQEGVKGVFRFLERNYEFLNRMKQPGEEWFKLWTDLERWKKMEQEGKKGETTKEIKNSLHKTIKKVTEDIEELKFNTSISSLMIFMNEIYKIKINTRYPEEVMLEESLSTFIRIDDYKAYIILLAPFAPHLAEELWLQLGEKESIFNQQWPKYNPKMIVEDKIEMVVQINGKVRDKIQVPADISEDEAKEKALASEKIKKYTDDQEIKKAIFIKGRLLNLVIK
jgi:leucyl-tRNA synthetase